MQPGRVRARRTGPPRGGGRDRDRDSVTITTVARRQWSIRLRLGVASAIVTAVVLLVTGWLALRVYDNRLDADVARGLADRFDNVALALSQDGIPAVAPALDRSEPLRGGVVQVITARGRVLEAVPTGSAPLLTAGQAAAATTSPKTAQRTYAGSPVVLRYAAVRGADGSRLVVAAADTLSDNRNAVSRIRALLLMAWVPAALLAGAGGWLLAGRALAPIDRILDHAARAKISDDSLEWWVPATGDEIERLARVVGDLLARLHEALHDQRNRFADAAHELRTPLTSLRGELDVLARGPLADDAGLRAARDSAVRLSDLVERVLVLSMASHGAALLRLSVTTAEVITGAVVNRHRRAHSAEISVRLGDGLPAFVCDRTRVEQILDNLLDNSLRAVGPGGVVEVAAEQDVNELEDSWVIFTVSDDGPGFPGVPPGPAPDDVFERFRHASVRAAGPDSGMGLGLAIVRELARAHGGDVRAANRPDGGAMVTVWLPVRGPSDALTSTGDRQADPDQLGASALPMNLS